MCIRLKKSCSIDSKYCVWFFLFLSLIQIHISIKPFVFAQRCGLYFSLRHLKIVMFCAAQTACIFRDHTIIGLRYRYIVGLYKYLLNVGRLNSKTNCDLQITVCFYFCVRSIWAPFVAGRTSNLQFSVFHVRSDVVVKVKHVFTVIAMQVPRGRRDIAHTHSWPRY